MKVKINGYEIEGTPGEIKELISNGEVTFTYPPYPQRPTWYPAYPTTPTYPWWHGTMCGTSDNVSWGSVTTAGCGHTGSAEVVDINAQ